MRRLLSILLENEAGALSRVVGLFSQRGYNIETLSVAPIEDSSLSRITISTEGDNQVLEQITKQLNKMVDVLKITDLSEGPHIERELMLIKVRVSSNDAREELKRTTDIFRGQVVDVTASSYTIQLTGPSEKLEAFIHTVSDGGEIIEVARSGVAGIARGERGLRP